MTAKSAWRNTRQIFATWFVKVRGVEETAKITSDMTPDQITPIVQMFNENPVFMKKHPDVSPSRVIRTTTAKLSTGANLQFQCRTHIHFDHEWKKKNEKQAAARVWRIEQSKEVRAYLLYTGTTVEDRIYMLQRNREAVLMKTMYDKSSLEEKGNLLFNKKDHEKGAEEYI